MSVRQKKNEKLKKKISQLLHDDRARVGYFSSKVDKLLKKSNKIKLRFEEALSNLKTNSPDSDSYNFMIDKKNAIARKMFHVERDYMKAFAKAKEVRKEFVNARKC